MALCEKYRAEPVDLATYNANTRQWVTASMQIVTPPDCKLGKTQ
jgi:hypothetical protein